MLIRYLPRTYSGSTIARCNKPGKKKQLVSGANARLKEVQEHKPTQDRAPGSPGTTAGPTLALFLGSFPEIWCARSGGWNSVGKGGVPRLLGSVSVLGLRVGSGLDRGGSLQGPPLSICLSCVNPAPAPKQAKMTLRSIDGVALGQDPFSFSPPPLPASVSCFPGG